MLDKQLQPVLIPPLGTRQLKQIPAREAVESAMQLLAGPQGPRLHVSLASKIFQPGVAQPLRKAVFPNW